MNLLMGTPFILRQRSTVCNSPRQRDGKGQKNGASRIPLGMNPVAPCAFPPGQVRLLPISLEGAPEGHPGPGDASTVLSGFFLELRELVRKGVRRKVLRSSPCLEYQFFVQHGTLPFPYDRLIHQIRPPVPCTRLNLFRSGSLASPRNEKRPGPEFFGSRPGFAVNGA